MNHIAPQQQSKPAKAWRSRVGVLVAAAVLAAGCSSTPATSPTVAQPAAHGVEAPIGSVPWSQVGPGWLLATWSPAADQGPSTTTLYLVDPAGGRYPITTFPPWSVLPPELVDWSGDGSHALLKTGDTTAILVELRTARQTTITVNGSPHFARPDGKAILVSTNRQGNSPATLRRVDLAGNQQLTYPTDKLGSAYNGGYLLTPDGAQLVLGTDNGLVLVSNDGTVGRRLPSPMAGAGCSPLRWWTPSVILASCTVHPADPYTASARPTQLWQIPLNGAPTALTAVNPSDGSDPAWDGDFGDIDAWQLPSGTYLQSLRSCGPQFLSRLTPDKHTTAVTLPGLDGRPAGGAGVIGVEGTALDLLAVSKPGCSGHDRRSSLLRYDPASNTSTMLLGPPVNGGAVIGARPYPGQH
jgi:Tol biopolymer transport system component